MPRHPTLSSLAMLKTEWDMSPFDGQWDVLTTANMVGIRTIQWDGGANYIVHGKWSRTLPPLNVPHLMAIRTDNLHLKVSIAADGFGPRHWNIPIKLLGPAEYLKYMENLVARAGPENVLPGPPPPS
jgi:hypothetical protein